tara:strand:- start:2 stop:868 length:867 start_codon:yes stop_codon:yes gene_type:complete
MKTVTSISGGKTSAFIAANYKSDNLVFALVRTDDETCRFKDKKLVQEVEDRIQKPFIGTLEEDTIIHTMLDLEQFVGQKIDWVSGITFDEVIETKGTWLPSAMRRYCTTWLKIEPIFHWWAEKFDFEPVLMNIGYRASEINRAYTILEKLNNNGLSEYKATFEKHLEGRHLGKNKWENIEWRKPLFPLIDDVIYKDEIERFWEDKPVRFAKRNNCVGCPNRNSRVLNQMSKEHPVKFNWFAKQEGGKKAYWKKDISYAKIKALNYEENIFNQQSQRGTVNCESGFCGV